MKDEEKLSNPKITIQTIQKYGFRFQKRYGQNFLTDSHVIRKILRAAEITEQDTVVEIGPGIGTLTQYLAEAAGKVYAVEQPAFNHQVDVKTGLLEEESSGIHLRDMLSRFLSRKRLRII